MKITDIEGMSAAELKAKAPELIAAVKTEPTLAERYVRARTDAALRDEKLAEQGSTIETLQSAHKSIEARMAECRQALQESKGVIAQARKRIDELEATVVKSTGERDNLTRSLNESEQREQEHKRAATGAAKRIEIVETQLSGAQQKIDELSQQVKQAEQARVQAENLAKARRGVLADVMNKITPLLANE